VEEADRQIRELEAGGLVVENDDCRYNSPAFLVKKRDRTMRMVVDYRRINKLIKPIIVALTRIDDLLNEIAASNPQFISTTDFSRGIIVSNWAQSTTV